MNPIYLNIFSNFNVPTEAERTAGRQFKLADKILAFRNLFNIKLSEKSNSRVIYELFKIKRKHRLWADICFPPGLQLPIGFSTRHIEPATRPCDHHLIDKPTFGNLNSDMADSFAAPALAAVSKKVKKAGKPKNPVDHPTYAVMVVDAIRGLGDRKGSSRQAILKHILANNKVDAMKAAVMVRKALSRLVAANQIVAAATAGRKGAGSFKLSPELKKAKPAQKTKAKKVAAKKTTKKAGAAKKAKKQVAKKPGKKVAKRAGAKKAAPKKPAKKVAKKAGAKK